jgi:hypothetical protein
VNSSPVGKVIRSSAVLVIMELQVPSNKWSPIGEIDVIVILILDTKSEFRKELEDPELRRVGKDNEFKVVRQMVNGNGSGSEIRIMVVPVVRILFRTCQSLMQYYGCNRSDRLIQKEPGFNL